ncbi:MAG: tRNA uridine-5-carboxymethylaminomethyl(34) synthesis GTPase MnmE [Butyrivibrio sp.]|nr:tRNA uridine-5-carboxymethylaminomethyl(34) synthesis GTPase MnmE [Butyrivibrio sp.]
MSDAGIGIIRISGSDAISICDKIYLNASHKHDLKLHDSNTIKFGYVCDFSDNILDEVMISVMKAPHTYTKEDVVEINTHGGVLILNNTINLLLKAGCRLAEPGEFTKRAFLNGRIDLTKAEAVMDIISAQNDFALKSSESQLSGSLFNAIKTLRESIIYEMAFIESALDDPENYSLEGYDEKLDGVIDKICSKISELIGSADEGIIRKNGISTVIIGKPNAGKSSLLNILAGEERAIVTDIAGTTRDIIRETIRLDDIILNVIDTAGIRNTDDVIEKIGVDKAKNYAMESELILYIIDSTTDLTSDDLEILELIKNKKTIILLNKSDLDSDYINEDILYNKYNLDKSVPIIRTSMLNNQGIEDLKKSISLLFFNGDVVPKQELYITNTRHKEALKNSFDSLQLVKQSIADGLSEDFYAVDLMNAYTFLGNIIGAEVGDDLVEEIFSKFCMGK